MNEIVYVPTCLKCGKKATTNMWQFCPFCGAKYRDYVMPKKVTKRRGTKGEGSISVINNKYVVRFGNRYVGYYSTYEEADRKRLEYKYKNKEADIEEDTLEDVYNMWFYEHCQNGKMTKGAIQSYQHSWTFFDDKIRKIRMVDVSGDTFQHVINSAAEKGNGYSVIAKLRTLISQLTKYALKKRYFNVDYSALLETPVKNEPKRIPQKLSKSDMKILWNNTDDETVKIILILCNTGFRPDELFSVKKTDIVNGVIVGGSKTEAGMNRRIPIHKDIQEFIDYFYNKNNVYLIESPEHKKVRLNNWRARYFYPTLLKLGILKDENDQHIKPSSTRKNFASMLKANRVDPSNIIELMGHTDIKTTDEYYYQIHDDEMAKILNDIDIKS